MGPRDKKQDATKGTKHVLVRVIGCTALFAVGACVQIAGITKPTLLDENAGGAGGEGGNGNSSSASSTSSSGSGGATSSSGSASSTSSSGTSSSTSNSSSSSGSIPCNNSGDCPPDTGCENWSCMMGMCGSTFDPMGTVAGDPTNGDCKADVCDGIGNVITGNDDTDTPLTDGNSCTNEGCNNGTPMTTNDPVGTACSGGKCNSMAMCVECLIDADCTTGTNPSCFQENCISCSDGMMNGDETGVDCGGTKCAKKCNGGACAAAIDCKSGFCADGVCCNAVCTGTCLACNLAATNGTCTQIPLNGTDNAPVCSGTSICNGAGACKLKNGESCSNDSECASNKCNNAMNTCVP